MPVPTSSSVKAASTVLRAARRGRWGAAWGHLGGAALSEGQQRGLYQLEAEGTPVSWEEILHCQ